MDFNSCPTPTHDVLCVGHASYDLVFSVSRHPLADEKIFADDFLACGGGPAANAAVLVARLGYRAAFVGYLGLDSHGESHRLELAAEGVDTSWVVRGAEATPVSAILVKPDGARALVNFKGATKVLAADAVDWGGILPKVLLFDGHEPLLSVPLAVAARRRGLPTVLDAGSLHEGTRALQGQVDYLVASEKFAAQWLQDNNPELALERLAEQACTVVITLGERGVIWSRDGERGALPAFPVQVVDTTGAGDAFHGAFAAGLAANLPWIDLLRYASAAGAFCCRRMGARAGLARHDELQGFLAATAAG